MDAGIIGGSLGAIIGVIGGAIGTYCSINNTKACYRYVFIILKNFQI